MWRCVPESSVWKHLDTLRTQSGTGKNRGAVLHEVNLWSQFRGTGRTTGSSTTMGRVGTYPGSLRATKAGRPGGGGGGRGGGRTCRHAAARGRGPGGGGRLGLGLGLGAPAAQPCCAWLRLASRPSGPASPGSPPRPPRPSGPPGAMGEAGGVEVLLPQQPASRPPRRTRRAHTRWGPDPDDDQPQPAPAPAPPGPAPPESALPASPSVIPGTEGRPGVPEQTPPARKRPKRRRWGDDDSAAEPASQPQPQPADSQGPDIFQPAGDAPDAGDLTVQASCLRVPDLPGSF